MTMLKSLAVAVALIATGGLLASAQGQTRTVTFRTASYEFKSQQVAGGSFAGQSFATFAGEAKSLNNKIAADLKGVTITIFYTPDENGGGTITGGLWTVLTLTKDRAPILTGGSIGSGGTVALKEDQTLAAGGVSLALLSSNPDLPTTGTLAATVDTSRPARLSGAFTLTYPVIL